MSLLDDGKAQVQEIVTGKPSQFTVGAYSDGHAVTGQLTFDRKWTNGWGLTAYAKAWWHDVGVTPSGVKVGAEGSYKF